MHISKAVANLVSSFFQSGSVTSSGSRGWTGGGRGTQLNYSLGQISNNSFQQLDPETALEVSVFYACVTKISKDIAKLPIDFKKHETNEDGIPIEILAPKHDVSRLMNVRPSTFDTTLPYTFKETILGWALRYQAGYAYIERDDAGLPISLDMIHPSRVTLRLNRSKNIVFQVVTGSSANGERPLNLVEIPEENMFYIHCFGNGQNGIPLTDVAKEALGIAKAGQQFNAKFFGNGLQVSAVLETPLQLNRDTKDEMKAQWKTEFGANGNSQGGIAILDADLKYRVMQMNSTDAELLSTRQFQIAEIARYFDMPLHKIQEMSNSTFNNVENQNIDYVTDTLTPWMIRFEQEIRMKLLPAQSPFFAEFNTWSLTKGDLKAQGDFYQVLLGGSNTPAVATPNEVRRLVGINPIDGGDVLYAPLNLVDVEFKGEEQAIDLELKKKELEAPTAIEIADAAAENAPDEPQIEESSNDSTEQAVDINKFRPMMVHEVTRLINKESNFINSCTKLEPEQYKEKAEKFYKSHLVHMFENLSLYKEFLNSSIDLVELCEDAVHLEKGDKWQQIEADYIIETIISKSETVQSMTKYEDGYYKGDDGSVYQIHNGEIIPHEA